MPKQPTIVLTRPAARQQGLIDSLASLSLPVLVLPALSIEPLTSNALVRATSTNAISNIEQSTIETSTLIASASEPYDLIVFVSRAAVENFPSKMCTNLSHTLLAAVGGQTAQAIRQRFGVTVNLVYPFASCQQDSEALWQLLIPHLSHIKRVLIVRGEWGREWLRERLLENGCEVDCLATYSRKPCMWSGEQTQALFDAWQNQTPLIWLFTSVESVDAVETQFKRFKVKAAHVIQGVVVTHPKVLSRVRLLLIEGNSSVTPTIETHDETLFELVAPNDQDILAGIVKLSKNS
jgi:uroporphyrinogen-III synthase